MDTGKIYRATQTNSRGSKPFGRIDLLMNKQRYDDSKEKGQTIYSKKKGECINFFMESAASLLSTPVASHSCTLCSLFGQDLILLSLPVRQAGFSIWRRAVQHDRSKLYNYHIGFTSRLNIFEVFS